jgi:hypothetical protein
MPLHSVLLGANDPTSPPGFPPGYYRDERLVLGKSIDPSLVALGYVEMSDEEFKVMVSTWEPAFNQWEASLKVAKETAAEEKVASLDSAFNQLQAIEEKIKGAGGALEPSDQTALLLYTLETLLLLREPLVQIQKRSL